MNLDEEREASLETDDGLPRPEIVRAGDIDPDQFVCLYSDVEALRSAARAALQQEVPAEPVGSKWDYTVVGWCDEWALKLNQDTSIESTPRPGRRPVYVRSPKQ